MSDDDGRNILTHTRRQTYMSCPRKHYFRYELGITRDRTAQPLRLGAAFHLGLDLRAGGESIDDAINMATADYEQLPAWCNTEDAILEWRIERETVRSMLSGYFWRWENDQIEILATEQSFEIPIVNPETGAPTPTFVAGGKIDKIVKLPDGRIAVMEHKTAGVDIASDSDYWQKLKIDSQISMYLLAARHLGFEAETVLYDVARKPSIRPKKLSKTDRQIFMNHGRWHGQEFETGHDVERESPEMFGARFLDDISERPDFYFQRQEIPRLDSDLLEFRHELWQIQQQIRASQHNNRWFRNSSQCLMMGRCEYADLCFQGVTIDGKTIPSGFKRLDYVHPELQGVDE